MKNNTLPLPLRPAICEAHIAVAAGENTPARLTHVVLDQRQSAYAVEGGKR